MQGKSRAANAREMLVEQKWHETFCGQKFNIM
jgi:hypothetical protein